MVPARRARFGRRTHRTTRRRTASRLPRCASSDTRRSKRTRAGIATVRTNAAARSLRVGQRPCLTHPAFFCGRASETAHTHTHVIYCAATVRSPRGRPTEKKVHFALCRCAAAHHVQLVCEPSLSTAAFARSAHASRVSRARPTARAMHCAGSSCVTVSTTWSSCGWCRMHAAKLASK